jgi:hypothetical protein
MPLVRGELVLCESASMWRSVSVSLCPCQCLVTGHLSPVTWVWCCAVCPYEFSVLWHVYMYECTSLFVQVPHCLGDTQQACSIGSGLSVHLGIKTVPSLGQTGWLLQPLWG